MHGYLNILVIELFNTETILTLFKAAKIAHDISLNKATAHILLLCN